MKVFGIITNREKDRDFKYTKILIESILKKGGEAMISADVAKDLEFDLPVKAMEQEDIFEKAEIIICLGGDGTFLNVARNVFSKNKPMLGINLGSLGFLTEIEKKDIDIAVENIINDKFVIEERMMLEAVIMNKGELVARDIALNDIVISRGALSRILHLKTYINNDFVDYFPGDGLIVASPTGSTAYSLSCGGPIVEPDVDLIIVTPICPHILYSRSIIAPCSRIVKVVVEEDYCHSAMVTVDGQIGYEIKGGFSIEVKKAEQSVKLIRMNQRNFFNVLRTKIYDRGEKLRRNEV